MKIIGCGDAFGSGTRFQTCFLVDDNHGRLLIDFGATSMVALNVQNISPASVDTILLSHLHGDHYGGLPSLLLHREYLDFANAPLTIAGPPGFPERLQQLVETMFPGTWRDVWSFPLHLIELAPDESHAIGNREIITAPVRHYAGTEISTAMRITTSGKVITYSGDAGWNDSLIKMSEGSDLFLCDCNDFVDAVFDGHVS